MMPIGPLMIEHRLIERVIGVLREELNRMKGQKTVDPLFIDSVVDFIRVYADRTHHGKEEDILFRDLEHKDLSAEDQRVMQELVDEHVYARQTVGTIVEAQERYLAGEKEALQIILEKVGALVELYPEHIEKEDRVFFPASMEYFSQEEQDGMLEEMWEFDRNMIHEKYEAVAGRLEKRV